MSRYPYSRHSSVAHTSGRYHALFNTKFNLNWNTRVLSKNFSLSKTYLSSIWDIHLKNRAVCTQICTKNEPYYNLYIYRQVLTAQPTNSRKLFVCYLIKNIMYIYLLITISILYHSIDEENCRRKKFLLFIFIKFLILFAGRIPLMWKTCVLEPYVGNTRYTLHGILRTYRICQCI